MASNNSYVVDIDNATRDNSNYRKVIHTTPQSQLVLMSLQPNEEIGSESHDGDQFIKVESGMGYAIINSITYQLNEGSAIVIAAGDIHNIIAGDNGLKLYAVYTPPEHEPGQLDVTKPVKQIILDIFDLIPEPLVQEIISSKYYTNLYSLYRLNIKTRNSIIDLLRTNELKNKKGIAYIKNSREKMEIVPILNDKSTSVSDQYKKIIDISCGTIGETLFTAYDGSVYMRKFRFTRQKGSHYITSAVSNSNKTKFIAGQLYKSRDERQDLGLLMDTYGRIYTFKLSNGRYIISKFKYFNHRKMIKLSVGAEHALLISERGNVYSLGRIADGRLGHSEDLIGVKRYYKRLEKIIYDAFISKRVVDISAGYKHSLCVTEDGVAYSFGDGEYGKLGNGRSDKHYSVEPIEVALEKNVVKVSAGLSHSIFLCGDNTLYACGNGLYGRLGDGNTDEHVEVVPIEIDTSLMTDSQGNRKTVIDIYASIYTSMFLCDDGTVYYCGNYPTMNITTGNWQPIPTLIKLLNDIPVFKISISGDTICYLT